LSAQGIVSLSACFQNTIDTLNRTEGGLTPFVARPDVESLWGETPI
jgi:hypothetical protein